MLNEVEVSPSQITNKNVSLALRFISIKKWPSLKKKSRRIIIDNRPFRRMINNNFDNVILNII